MNINLASDPIGHDGKDDPVFKDIWPSSRENCACSRTSLHGDVPKSTRSIAGTEEWKAIYVARSDTYDWQDDSTYIRVSDS
ncbi:hypothetical protein ACNKHS_07560 [Shigella flexneri]